MVVIPRATSPLFLAFLRVLRVGFRRHAMRKCPFPLSSFLFPLLLMHSLSARPGVQALRSSKIREVANAGMGKKDVIAFWFGEPDEVTPDFIRQAGIEALQRGDTFYTENFGIPELRETIAAYVARLHAPACKATIDNVTVPSSGMSGLMLANRALVGPGDRVVIVAPVWPNLVEIPRILGAEAVTFAGRASTPWRCNPAQR